MLRRVLTDLAVGIGLIILTGLAASFMYFTALFVFQHVGILLWLIPLTGLATVLGRAFLKGLRNP